MKSQDMEAVVAALDEQGYCLVESLISREKADAVRSELDRLRREEYAEREGENHQRICGLIAKSAVFIDLVCHPFMVAVWREYLGANMVCYGFSSNTMMPGQGGVNWHVDYPLGRLVPLFPSHRLVGRAIWMLDDFTEENGATGIVPRSHLRGRPPLAGEKSVWPADAVVATGPRGSALLYHQATWHTSRPNESDSPRSALPCGYAQPYCIRHEDTLAELEAVEEPSETLRQLFAGYAHTSPDDRVKSLVPERMREAWRKS